MVLTSGQKFCNRATATNALRRAVAWSRVPRVRVKCEPKIGVRSEGIRTRMYQVARLLSKYGEAKMASPVYHKRVSHGLFGLLNLADFSTL